MEEWNLTLKSLAVQQYYVVSNRIGMKFGRIVLPVNAHQRIFTAQMRDALHSAALRLHDVVRLPAVCPSVTLVDQDHIGWKFWKLIAVGARTISPTTSLIVAQRPST